MILRWGAALAAALVVAAGTPAPAAESSRVAAAPRVLRVMPLGDSITAGSGDPVRNGWRPALKARLAAAGVPVDFVGSQHSGTGTDVQHEGHGGWTIAQLAVQAPGWVRAYAPDVVLLMAGTNDVLRRDQVPAAGARLSALVRSILAARPGVRVIVASIPQMRVTGDRVALWNSYRSQVLRAAAVLGVGFAPGHRVYVSDLAADGVHPSPCGYDRLAWVWFYAWTTTFRPPAGRVWDSGPWPRVCP